MIIYDDVEQGTDRWFELRLASIGGSGINDAAAKGKGHDNYAVSLAGEFLSGVKAESYRGWQHDRGNKFEDVGRRSYQLITGYDVRQVGLAKESDHKHYSPDGLVGEDGLIEIKIAIPSVFIDFAQKKTLPTDRRRQVQWGFRILNRKWCDFVLFCPEIDAKGIIDGTIIERYYPNQKEMDELDKAADSTIAEMYAIVRRMKEL